MTAFDLSAIADHLWQSTAVAVVAWLVTLILKKNSAAVRYRIWVAASVKFLVPFSLLIALGSQFRWRTTEVAAPQFSTVVSQISQPFEISGDMSSAPLEIPEGPGRLPEILLVIWLGGVALGVAYWLRLFRETMRIRREGARLDLGLPVPVLQAAKTACVEPGVFGIVRPVLILPAGITDTLTPAQLDSVIAHELHHVRRRDNLTAAIHMVVEILFWFHPLVRGIRRRLVEERELACDEAVAGVARNPQVYAEAILNICRLYIGSPAPFVSGVTGADLKKRIEAIMRNRTALGLDFTRKAVLAVAATCAVGVPLIVGLANAPAVQAQSKDGRPKVSFEVASIRVAVTPARGPAICLTPCTPGERLTIQGARVDIRYMPIIDLITRAYRVKPFQVTGPAWIRTGRFDIAAKIPVGVSADRLPEMLQSLLADRFRLAIHRETKELPVYALLVGKNGIRLQPAAPDAANQLQAGPKAMSMFTPEGDAHLENGHISISSGVLGPVRSSPGGKWEMLGITMPGLAELLSAAEDHPVIDETHLAGAYRLSYEISMKEGAENEQGSERVLASLTDGLDKGGLRLERRNARIETIVVDHVERTPTEN